ncbi:ATP-binding cassette domain-containing protein [Hyphomonas sp.]|uniref:ATP-binding cassette domain-containing protein n=1 Tax=Hyphomonas sp. TaxID=87 RepID=UPI001BCF195D|nr:ATP-binding cassette domain-containing protein [Hyphomonas sp.]
MPASITLASVTYALADGRVLFSDLSFSFNQERVGLVGRNGVGKSSLLTLIAGAAQPAFGAVRLAGTIGTLRQSFTPEPAETLARLFGAGSALGRLARIEAGEGTEDDFAQADWTLEARLAEALARAGLSGIGINTPLMRLSGGQRTRASLAALARFRFRAGAARQTVSTLSGGERLRAGLACVLGGRSPPQLLILDEPTNHLDVASLETVEAGLNAYDGALLIVSHDEAFLARIGITRRISL